LWKSNRIKQRLLRTFFKGKKAISNYAESIFSFEKHSPHHNNQRTKMSIIKPFRHTLAKEKMAITYNVLRTGVWPVL
jgi:hypothetical protein